MPRVLHLPCSYLPWTVGGKETFTHGLACHLKAAGWDSHIALHQNPSSREPLGRNEHDGIPVHVLPPLHVHRGDVYSCRTGEVPGFEALLRELTPDVVHFQDFSSGANLHHLELARAAGARTIMSYHSPGQSCLERELLYNGTDVCDGEIRLDRCTACRLAVQGVPAGVRWPLAKVSLPLAVGGRLGRALSARAMTAEFIQAWRSLVRQVDRIHIHAEWVRGVMARNQVPPEKLTFFRLGLPMESAPAHSRQPRRPGDPLRLVMVGRCDRIKGQAVLIDAVKGLPADVPVQVAFVGPYWDATEYGRMCLRNIQGDSRFLPPRTVSHPEIPMILAAADALVVPSIWLETGPLVVLEAFASKVPVIGSRLGGIAELVRHERDGLLFEPNSANELRETILRLAGDPNLTERLRHGIEPPRTMRDVARDADALYRELLGW